ncbi:hypothetical protein ABEG10_13870 [Burkholderia cenocepacia]|uniref:hypothetical protein n=1 Tax=Burkholderia cenocepacia TaxID=95486 RepID=UPI00209F2BE9|nr:hypothetical protein [Burkholderia cenocepacia]MCO8326805.1 hypothetical protein [Burkholderia cenocepacia]MCO8333868.1 hypothetical protein [Burkholderia cenocepacia]MCO8341241.1 hypothetical protein [Burkholderia cenocepacia]MCO8348661.1 hypothetical protein [Burkholderia cenocepacia]MCO8361853.1 hypothetical protein [Burkholderia cenocepacia]
MKLTEKDSLDYGIEYPADSGQMHYDFELRLATVADNIAAYEEPTIIGGGVCNMRVNAAVLARSIVSLGTIPAEAITPELIDTAIESDYDKFFAAQERLKKKRKALKPGNVPSDLPPSSSASTVSATNASGS